MKQKVFFFLLISIFVVGCSEEVDMSNRYVFTDRTITDYLSEHEEYSEYMKLLDKLPVSPASTTTFRQLFTARGHYTVFAPTNEAIQLYLDDLLNKGLIHEASWDGFDDISIQDSIERVIVFNSIIDSGDDNEAFHTYDFPTKQDAEIMKENMYDRKLVVHYNEGNEGSDIQINGSDIDEKNRDIPMMNGLIHAMKKVIAPSNNRLGYWLTDILKFKQEGYYVSAMLIQAAGLIDTLNAFRDEVYEKLYLEGYFDDDARFAGSQPEHRKYGFTLFAETDSVWSETIGKPALDITVDDVMQFLRESHAYPEATDDNNYTEENNLLNRFVTYHLLPVRLAQDRLVFHTNERGYDKNIGRLGCAVFEYYTTMGKRCLLKIFESKESHGVFLNRCPILDNGRHGTYQELSCPTGREGILIGTPNLEGENNLMNALVYPIDKFLFYDEETRQNLGRERIRIDAASISPEMMNNDLRLNPMHQSFRVAPDGKYPYFQDLRLNTESTNYGYYAALMESWNNYQSDEVNIWGVQDITITLPPVPRKDVYELRYGYSVYDYRGIFQMYFGTDPDKLAPADIPLDMRTQPDKIGWEADSEDDDYNAEVDKRMRNNGYMKGALSYAGGGNPPRSYMNMGRRIFVRQQMDPDKTYYLRMKECLEMGNWMNESWNCQLYMDIIELCPKSIYDNPNEPEDIW